MTANRISVYGLVGFIAFISGGWLLQRAESDAAADTYANARVFEEVLQHVASYYVDSLSEAQLYDLAIDGMLESLGDPYTAFLRQRELRDLTLSTTGNYGGLGIRIDVRDGWITIITPLPDTPADRVGLEPGDRIVEVEGVSTEGWSSSQAVNELKGEPGTDVRIKIMRPGYSELLPFTVTRAMIHVNSVGTATMLDREVGYVSLATVAETTAREFEEAVADLVDRGATSLVLDLRNNPGGILMQGVGVVDLFLGQGEIVVETRGRASGASRVYRSTSEPRWPDIPLVVLVNQLSASAAEIIAGALQDHDRALILGMSTFGKGVAQLVFRIGENQALRVTTSKWYTPLGRTLQRTAEADARESLVALLPGAADSTHSDSSSVFVTPSGRELFGGGGIVPDVTVASAEISEEQQLFADVLGSGVPIYQDVLTSYAIEIMGRDEPLSGDVTISDDMLDEVRRRLDGRGVAFDDAQWAQVDGIVERQFGYVLTRYLIGRTREAELRARNDEQILAALRFLTQVQSQEELLALVPDSDDQGVTTRAPAGISN